MYLATCVNRSAFESFGGQYASPSRRPSQPMNVDSRSAYRVCIQYTGLNQVFDLFNAAR
jgi:hypothetical protein